MNRFVRHLLWILPVLLSAGCSEPQQPPMAPQAVAVHPAGWLRLASSDFHGRAIAAQNYNMNDCRQCHGADYRGGVVDASCLVCHTHRQGPEACNTCHGIFAGDGDDVAAYSPPRGLDGATASTDPGVGAHEKHMRGASVPAAACAECHTLPGTLNAPGHLDGDGRAELVFSGPQAQQVSEGGARVPAVMYERQTLSCQNTYCHGNWGISRQVSGAGYIYTAAKMEGNTAAPVWNDPASGACGTCHGLPPTGHREFELAECRLCHSSVVDESGAIIDANKHINGMVNVFGQESSINAPQVITHPPDWLQVESENFHGKVLAANNYNLEGCQICHGEQYDGGFTDQTCLTCHRHDDGPEACNTCHGDFGRSPLDFVNNAPPKGLENERDPAQPAVGAHQAHLRYYDSAEAACMECHAVPDDVRAAGHLDGDGRAEALFAGPLGSFATEGGTRIPAAFYDTATLSCQNTYCHGNWGLRQADSQQSVNMFASATMEGNNAAPVWNDQSSAACGTCHNLPPRGHLPAQLRACTTCHASVVDDQLNIVDKSKHVNGKVNVFGQEFDMY